MVIKLHRLKETRTDTRYCRLKILHVFFSNFALIIYCRKCIEIGPKGGSGLPYNVIITYFQINGQQYCYIVEFGRCFLLVSHRGNAISYSTGQRLDFYIPANYLSINKATLN